MWIHLVTIILILPVLAFGDCCLFRSSPKKRAPQTGSDLQDALDKAVSGDIIDLAPIIYVGDFNLTDRNASKLITIRGTSNRNGEHTKIIGTHTAFSIHGNRWSLQNLAIQSGFIGIDIKGDRNLIKAVSIKGVNETAIRIEGNSNLLHSVAIKEPNTCIILRGNRNAFRTTSCFGARQHGVVVETGNGTDIDSVSIIGAKNNASSLTLEKESCCGQLNRVSTDGFVEIKGDSYFLNAAAFSGNGTVAGCSNIFRSSAIANFIFNKDCKNDVEG